MHRLPRRVVVPVKPVLLPPNPLYCQCWTTLAAHTRPFPDEVLILRIRVVDAMVAMLGSTTQLDDSRDSGCVWH